MCWQDNTTVPEDNGVFLALLQLVPDWVLQVGLRGGL